MKPSEIAPLSPLEKLLGYHRLLRLIQEESSELNEEFTAQLVAIILDRIEQLELPAATQLDKAREERGCSI
ncbi:hypothetical protein [Occallatibacter savannae]|uniref:hypothetical protein n=1 Tax=Occallatibacter savannae TaxID=1002691 RepID=UPI000D68CF5F|nr:hypothetical protein [Occallatibacter savannae]